MIRAQILALFLILGTSSSVFAMESCGHLFEDPSSNSDLITADPLIDNNSDDALTDLPDTAKGDAFSKFLTAHYPGHLQQFKDPAFVEPTDFSPPSTYKQGARAVRREAKLTGSFFIRDLVPQATFRRAFNWRPADENLPNLENQAFSQREARRLTEFSTMDHMGLYMASDPFTYGARGSIDSVLMVVDVYEKAFPVRSEEGKINWIQMDGKHVSYDGSASLDMVNGAFPGHHTVPYVVRDLRAIKKLRYPPKELIVWSWRHADFLANYENKSMTMGIEAVRAVSAQWLLTSNFSLAERVALFKEDPERFANFVINTFGECRIPWRNYGTTVIGKARLQNNIFKTLFNSNTNFVDDRTSVIRYGEILKRVQEMPEETFQKILQLSRKSEKPTSTLLALKLAVSYRLKDKEAWDLVLAKIKADTDAHFKTIKAQPRDPGKNRSMQFMKAQLEELSAINPFS